MKGLHGLGLVLLEQLGQNILESVLANSDSVEVSVVQKKGAGWRKNDKHVMHVFDVWWGLNYFWRNFYAVETAWRVQRNSNIISKEIPEAFYVFIIFAQWQYFLVNFFWNSDAFLLYVYWNSSEFLLLLLHFCLQFLCISDFLKEFLMNFLCMSYAFLMNFLRISYAILMHFLCNSYAVFTTSYVLGKSVCSFGKSVWSF